MNLQDAFLNQLRLAKVPVSVYLTGGQQLKGVIKGFDNFSLMIDLSGKPSLVYKHSISSIVPQVPISFFNADDPCDEKEASPK